MHTLFVTIGRVLLGLFFVVSALLKIKAGIDAGGVAGLAGYIGSRGLPQPQMLAYMVIAFELVAGVLIVIGFLTTPVALLLAIYCLLTAGLFHNFWAVPTEQLQAQIAFFLKNVGLAGAFLVLAGEGIRVRLNA